MYMFVWLLYVGPPGKLGIGFALTSFLYKMWMKFGSMLLLLCGQDFT
jgi:hypothetical protein